MRRKNPKVLPGSAVNLMPQGVERRCGAAGKSGMRIFVFYLLNPLISRNRAFVKRLRIIDEFGLIRDFLLPERDSTNG
ncbi:hypothetical protein [Burkholderia lata]|uniref:hypothetical protein n=1 Tax=Burkholderia lata (strain ATCC 17760 / DSM 23089 / LMG 22485 / NCIMB 9086 / R18194 / 383) TaxID=482957 RepID=UPI001582177C|nr:hypothetical protein [Burkholderia lata]